MPGWAPKHVTTGIWSLIEAQKASMVWMRRRWALSAFPSERIRFLISAAALMVKVMATTSSGFSTTERIFR